MKLLVSVAQIIAALILIILVLIQERSSGLSSVFGGDNVSFYQTRRGLERLAFWATVVAAFLFGGLSILNLVV